MAGGDVTLTNAACVLRIGRYPNICRSQTSDVSPEVTILTNPRSLPATKR